MIIPLPSCLGLVFGQPFQPPVDLAQLFGVGRRFDAVRQVRHHHHVALHIPFGIVDPVDGRGSVDCRPIDAPLERYAKDRAYLADRDVRWFQIEFQTVPCRPLFG